MPPKKKPRAPSRAASTSSGDNAQRTVDDSPTPAEADHAKNVEASEPWTDEQETSLYKAMIRWKPVGMHKHFRMLAISEHMKNHGYNGYTSPQEAHTTSSGIWRKLESLYNLDVLDFREDNIDNIPDYEFSLPDDEYWSLKFARRLASPDGSSSPPSSPHQLSNPLVDGGRPLRRHSTVDDTDEPRSSPASTRGTPSRRGARASRGTRSSRLAEVSTLRGKYTGKTSTEQGTEDEDKEEEEDDDDDDAMDEDDHDAKATATKGRGKASKAAAKHSTRRSGRKK